MASKRRSGGHPKDMPLVITGAQDAPAGGASLAEHQNVFFVHSSFRTSSTWIWTKLRSARSCLTYYEVFNPMLAKMQPAAASTFSNTSWRSKHPVAAPYFLEFLPLLEQSGGILEFAEDMTIERFIPEAGIDGALSSGEKDYLNRLIGHARQLGRIPVLTCTRSLGRARAIARHTGCKSILIFRNLFHQWASYSEQYLHGNHFFIGEMNAVIDASSHDQFLSLIKNAFPVVDASLFDQSQFIRFVLFHIYLYAKTYDIYDHVIDISSLSYDDSYRKSVESWFYDQVSSRIDLSDVKLDFGFNFVEINNIHETADILQQFLKIISSYCSTAESAQFAERAMHQVLEDLARYHFYTQNITSVMIGKKPGQETEDALLQRRREQWGIVNEALVSGVSIVDRLGEFRGKNADLASRVDALTVERDGTQGELIWHKQRIVDIETTFAQAQTAEVARQQAEVAHLSEERDTLSQRLAQLADSHHAEAAEIVRQQDVALQAQRDEARQREETLRAENERLQAELSSALQSSAAVSGEKAAILQESDVLRQQMAEQAAGLQRLEDSLAATVESARAQESAVRTELDGTRQREETLRAENERLQAELSSAFQSSAALSGEKAAILQESDVLRQQMAEQAAGLQRLEDSLAATVESARAQESALRTELDGTRQREETLRAENERLIAELVEVRRDLVKGQGSLETLQRTLAEVGQNLDEHKASKAELLRDNDNLRMQMTDQSAELRRLNEGLAAAAEAAQTQERVLQGQISHLREQEASFRAQIEQLGAQLAEVQRDHADSQAIVLALQADAAAFAAKSASVQAEKVTLLEDVRGLRSQLAEQAAELQRLHKEHAAAVEAATAKGHMLQGQADTMREEIVSLESENAKLREELAQMAGEHLSAREESEIRLAATEAKHQAAVQKLKADLEARHKQATERRQEIAKQMRKLTREHNKALDVIAQLRSERDELMEAFTQLAEI